MVETATARPPGETLVERRATRLSQWAPLPLRLVLGFGFLYHGYPKLFTAEGNEAIVGMLAGMGLPTPTLFAYLIAFLEFFGGIMLLLGVAVRIIAALGAVEMAVAAYLVHWQFGFNFMNITGVEAGVPQFGMPGYEVNLLYIAGFLALVLGGGGYLSLPVVRTAEDEEAEDAYEEREVVSTRE